MFSIVGRSAFIGIGFTDRSDSFDLNVALQDHFKRIKNCEEIEKEKEEPKQQLDLRFKEGETIKINMKITVSTYIPSSLVTTHLTLVASTVLTMSELSALRLAEKGWQ